MIRRLGALIVVAAVTLAAALSPVHAADPGCASAAQTTELKAGEILTVNAKAAGYLVIRELGVDLLWSDSSERWQGVDFRPPRLGLAFIPIVEGQAISVRAARPQAARLRLEQRCAADLSGG